MEKTILLKYLKIYLDIDLKIILLNYQTIKISRRLMDEECCKKLWHSSNQFECSNYFDDLTKSFLDLYLAKFSIFQQEILYFYISAKSFFSCKNDTAALMTLKRKIIRGEISQIYRFHSMLCNVFLSLLISSHHRS